MQIKLRFDSRLANRWAERFSKQGLNHAARVLAPTLLALSLTTIAHAQGTMDFSGAQTLMTTFKTSLAYHLSWMFADRGTSTLVVDLDPQANLTGMFLPENTIEKIWDSPLAGTIAASIEPLKKRTGDIRDPYVHRVTHNLGLVLGDLSLSRFEDLLSENWPKAVDGDESAFRVLSSFDRIIRQGAAQIGAELALIDVGPNLGAINRTALLAADFVERVS